MITTINKKIAQCDICKKEEEFEFTKGAPDEWWVIRFARAGLTLHAFDMCPNCTKKAMEYLESAKQEAEDGNET